MEYIRSKSIFVKTLLPFSGLQFETSIGVFVCFPFMLPLLTVKLEKKTRRKKLEEKNGNGSDFSLAIHLILERNDIMQWNISHKHIRHTHSCTQPIQGRNVHSWR